MKMCSFFLMFFCFRFSGAPNKVVSSSPKPPGRATGKTGAKWTEEATKALLDSLKSERPTLRQRVTPMSVWEKISDCLFNAQTSYDYSKEQVQEKMRNLKRGFADCKKGKNGGDKWKFYELMKFLYDDPIIEAVSVFETGMLAFFRVLVFVARPS